MLRGSTAMCRVAGKSGGPYIGANMRVAWAVVRRRHQEQNQGHAAGSDGLGFAFSGN